VVDGGVGVSMQAERAEDAGEVDDAAGGALADQREELLSEGDGSEEVGFKDAVEQVEGDVGGVVLGTGAGESATGNAGVVDEDIQAAVVRVKVIVGRLVVGGFGDVELKDIDVGACFFLPWVVVSPRGFGFSGLIFDSPVWLWILRDGGMVQKGKGRRSGPVFT